MQRFLVAETPNLDLESQLDIELSMGERPAENLRRAICSWQPAQRLDGEHSVVSGKNLASVAVRVCGLFWFGFSTVGCASVVGSHERQVKTVLSSKSVVKERFVTGLFWTREPEWQTPDRLTVELFQHNGCRAGFEDTVSTTTVTSTETKDVGLVTAWGLGLAASGGVALAVSPSLSDQKSTDDKTSSRESAVALGAVALGAGVLMVGQAAYIALKSADAESEPSISHQVRAESGPVHACGSAVAGPGKVVAHLDDKSYDLESFSSGKGLLIAPRQYAQQLCRDRGDVKKSVRLEYVLAGTGNVRLVLGKYRLLACVSATVASDQTALATSLLTGQSDAEVVARAVRLMQDAEELAQSLPQTDPERSSVVGKVANGKALARARASELLSPLFKKALVAIDADVSTAVPAANDALSVSALTDDAVGYWRKVYQAFVARAAHRGFEGYELVQKLLVADTVTNSCLTSANCPHWLKQEEARAALDPAAAEASNAIALGTKKLDGANVAVTKKATVASVRNFDEAVMRTRGMVSSCRSGAPALSTETCANLLQADARASVTLARDESKLTQIRNDEARAQHLMRQKDAVQAWHQHFAECRRLQSGIDALEAVSICNDACQKIVGKMRQERERLRGFSVDELVIDPVALGKLRTECSQASCEACP
jgi:hypothetical protein